MNKLLELKDISLHGNNPQNSLILSEISLSADKQNLITIIGPAGSGKSTLLSIIDLTTMPDTGELLINDTNMLRDSNRSRNSRSELFGHIFSKPNLVPSLTIYENIIMPSVYSGRISPSLEKQTKDMLEKSGLSGQKNSKPQDLTAVDQQIASILRAFVSNPSIVIAYEPTAQLDAKSGKTIMELLRKLTHEEDTLTIVATHDSRKEAFADEVFYLQSGKISTSTVQDQNASVLRDLTEGVIIIDNTNQITMMNHQAENIFGVSEIEALDTPIQEIMPLDHPKIGSKISLQDYDTYPPEFVYHTQDDEGMDVFVQLRVSKPDQSNTQSVIIIKDVTEFYYQEQQKEMFLNEISHYLRTPLTIIKGITSNVFAENKKIKSEPINDMMVRLGHQTSQLEILIEKLIIVAGIDKEAILNKKQTNINELIDEIVQGQENIIANKPVSIITNYGPNSDLLVAVDRIKIQMALSNILDNAVKFTEKGTITISTKVEGKGICITISDTGIGMDKNTLTRVFERFHYASHHLDETRQGIGIGLFLSKKLIELHSGSISITSTPQQGTEVNVTLPLDA